MKRKKSEKRLRAEGGVLVEYDFTSGIRGKHYSAYRAGHKVKIGKADGSTTIQHFTLSEGAVVLEPDVRKYFPDSKAVNRALRSLITLIPKQRGA
jgi:hypothetical protein